MPRLHTSAFSEYGSRALTSGAIYSRVYTASILNRFVVGDDGQTAHQRFHGRRANKKAVEFGEKLFDDIPRKLQTKMNTRWRLGCTWEWHHSLANALLGHGMEMSSAPDLLFEAWKTSRWDTDFLVKLKGAPSKPIHSGVDRYGRIEECEDPHAMIEVDPEKHAQQKFDH